MVESLKGESWNGHEDEGLRMDDGKKGWRAEDCVPSKVSSGEPPKGGTPNKHGSSPAGRDCPWSAVTDRRYPDRFGISSQRTGLNRIGGSRNLAGLPGSYRVKPTKKNLFSVWLC